MCTRIQYILLLFIGAALYGLFFQSSQERTATIVVDTHELEIIRAESFEELQKGLAGYTSLADNKGMLFVFPDYGIRTFWMKGMLIPIDIIWIRDTAIVGFVDNAQAMPETPLSQLPVFSSPEPINYVLEVRAGLRKEKGWDIGTQIKGLD